MPYSVVRNVEYMNDGSLGKETMHNDFVLNAVLGISGAATIPLSSTDHTLTTTNDGEAMRFVQILVGALTANVNVIVPAESRVYVIDNRTSGAFTVTCRPAAGGGVAVDQSARTLIYCDGANVYPVASGTGGGGGSGAPTDASYLVGASSSLLTAERLVTDTTTISWDLATAGQAKASIPPDAVSYAHIQNVASSRLLGRFAAGSGDVQEITPGTGLSLDTGTGVLSATAVGQPLDATLTALAGLATGANQLPYSTGTDTFSQTPLTAFARTLLDDADAATMRGTLSAQASDATLTALAGVTTGADTLPFFTGVDTASTTTLTAFMRGLLDDPDAATARTTLGVTGGGGGSTDFLGLTDTPDAYTGHAGKVVQVNAGATGLDFITSVAGYTDEQAQDAVGAMLAATATIALAYADATPALTAAVLAGSIGTAELTNDGVTYAKIQNVTDARLLGRSAGSNGDVQEITPGTGITLSGGVLTATGEVSPVPFRGCLLKRSADSAALGASIVTLTWDTEDYDTDGFHSTGTNPSRITIPAGVTKVRFTLGVLLGSFTASNTAVAFLIRANGVTTQIAKEERAHVTYNDPAACVVTGVLSVTPGDYYEAFVLSGHTAAIVQAQPATFFACEVVEPYAVGTSSFLALTDTPDTYTGQGSKIVQVNAGATALEFVAQDPELAALSLLTSAADRVPYFTGSGTAALATFTAAGRTLAGAADAAAQRTALALGTMAQQNAASVAITGGSATLDSLTVTGITQLKSFVGLGPTGYYEANIWFTIAYDKTFQNGLYFRPTVSDAGGGKAQSFFNVGGGEVGSITTTGAATAYNTTSDVRLKHAIAALTGALDVVRALRPVAFRWNSTDELDEGFLAHELQQVMPRAVIGEPDAVHDDGSVKPQQVDHSKLVVWLVGAVQELTARVVSLETQLGV